MDAETVGYYLEDLNRALSYLESAYEHANGLKLTEARWNLSEITAQVEGLISQAMGQFEEEQSG